MNANSLFLPENPKSLSHKARMKRFAFFRELINRVATDKPLRILDVGGTQAYWEAMNFTQDNRVHITLLNLEKAPVKYKNFSSVKGDACHLPYEDKSFDIVFSNSVIEHLFTKQNQVKMANEVRRVGKYYYVQTPNYYFPIEPHWVFPLFQFLPFNWRVFLTKHFDLGHYKKSSTQEKAIMRVQEVKLLTEREMKELFPDGNLYQEDFFGLTKSLTMYRFPSS